MNNSFHNQFKNYSTVDLLKITLRPESYQHAAVVEATEILKTRVITQADLDDAERLLREEELAPPKKWQIANIFKISSYNHEQWLNVILGIAVFEYLRLLYIDIKMFDHVLNGQGDPFRMTYVMSYLDLLLWPFVYYMFYKRMRWGWIAFFGIKLFTIEPSLLYYFNEYWPVEHGIGLITYPLLTIFLDIPILIFLWKQEISSIFQVNIKTKRLTLFSILIALALLTYIGQYNQTNYTKIESDTENQPETAGMPLDTITSPPPKLLALIEAAKEKPVDTTYMRTGFYFLTEKGMGIDMRVEKSDEIYTISPLPFASVKNISKVNFEKIQIREGEYTEACMTFDDTGTTDLAKGTGNPQHPKIAVVVANKLLYVVENKTSIKTGVMCVALIGYSKAEIASMQSAIEHKR